MGNRASKLLALGSVEPPDKVTGLSELEKRAIQENWRIIYRDLKGNGVELFVRWVNQVSILIGKARRIQKGLNRNECKAFLFSPHYNFVKIY